MAVDRDTLFPLLSILLGTREGEGRSPKAHLFSELEARLPTRSPAGLEWVQKGLQVSGNPTPGPSQPSSCSSGGEAESGSPANQQLPPPFPGPLPEDVQHGHRMRVTSYGSVGDEG